MEEVDDLAYVVAIGIDKGKTNRIKMTFQIPRPSQGGGESSSKSGGNEGVSDFIFSVETPSIYSGLNMANSVISKKLNLMHTKLIVFSKEMAEGDFKIYLHAIQRYREFRPDMQMVISRNSAEDFIKKSTPKLSLNSAKYYEKMFDNYKYTGFSANSQLSKFYDISESYYREPVAMLGSSAKFESTDEINSVSSTYKEKGRDHPLEGDFKAGDITWSGTLKSEHMGLAVFRKNMMVGEMDGEETEYYLIASNEYDNSYWTFMDPKHKEKHVVVNVSKARKPVYKVDISNGKPNINLKVILEGDILSIQSGENYEIGKGKEELEKSIEDEIKNGMVRFLYKTSQEFESDICGFGASAKGNFLTWKEWMDFNWLDKYKYSSFNVEIDFKIRRTGLMIRTVQ